MKKYIYMFYSFVFCGLFSMIGCKSDNYDNTFAEAEKILTNLEDDSSMSKDEVKEQLLLFFNTIQPIGSQLAEERSDIENSEEELNEFKSTTEYLKMQDFNRRLVELRRNNPVVDELAKNDPDVGFACIQAGF